MRSAHQERSRARSAAPVAERHPDRRRGLEPGQQPRLSVVIVNYRQWEETAGLTDQVLQAAAARPEAVEVIIVDNHSPAHPLTAQLRRRPGVSLRRWKRNRGFARAVNEGCRLSRGSWLLLLNPDVTLGPGFLEGALTLIERLPVEDPQVGIVGCHLHNRDGTRQGSTGAFPTLAGTLTGLLWPRARRKYGSPPTDRPSRVPWATACCLLVRRACVEQLGGLDEDFFLYYEDVDLCRRARRRGWSVRFEPGLHAVHHWPLHLRAVSAPLRLCTRHGLLVYGSKHWPAWQLRLLAGIIGLEARLRQGWARWRGETRQVAQFRELAEITRALARGRRTEARRRVDLAVR